MGHGLGFKNLQEFIDHVHMLHAVLVAETLLHLKQLAARYPCWPAAASLGSKLLLQTLTVPAALFAAVACTLQHCTPLFVSTDMPRAELAKVCLSLAQMADASALVFAANSNMPQQALAPLREGSAAINKYPAWTAAKRPASAMQQLEMQWCLPLQQLKELGTTHLSRAAEQPGEAFTSSTGSGKQTWQGQSFVLALQITSDAAAPRKTSIGLYLCMPRLQPGVVRSVEY